MTREGLLTVLPLYLVPTEVVSTFCCWLLTTLLQKTFVAAGEATTVQPSVTVPPMLVLYVDNVTVTDGTSKKKIS